MWSTRDEPRRHLEDFVTDLNRNRLRALEVVDDDSGACSFEPSGQAALTGRRARMLGSTAHSTPVRVTQAIRNLPAELGDTGHFARIRFLIRDRDAEHSAPIEELLGTLGLSRHRDDWKGTPDQAGVLRLRGGELPTARTRKPAQQCVSCSCSDVTPEIVVATDRSTQKEEADMADSVECAYCGQKKSERVNKCPHCGNG